MMLAITILMVIISLNISASDYKNRWWALIGLGMALVLLNLDLTLVNLALPVLGQRFHASMSQLQWVNNIYSLTFAALVALTGKIADHHGHKKMYLFGIIFFFLGSLLGGVAPNISSLIIGRLLQGVGMAGTFGMVFILANASFPPEKRSYAIGLLVVFVGVAQALGPTVGGWIIDVWGWRWAFLINLPFCLISFVLVCIACKRDALNVKGRIHYISGIAFLVAYFVFVTAFNEMNNWGADSLGFIGLLILGLLIFVGTLFWQSKLKTPFFDLSLFAQPIYRLVNLIRPLFQFNFGAFFFILPLYLQNVVGLTPGSTGLVMLIMTLPLAICSVIAGKLNGKIAPEASLIFAHVVALMGYLILAIAPVTPINWWLFSIALICIGANVGVMYSTTNYLAINSLPLDKKGVGYGFFSANAYFFYSIGVALAGFLLTTIAYSHFKQIISTNSHLNLYVNGARPISDLAEQFPGKAHELVHAATLSFARGYSSVMWLFAVLALLGLVLIGLRLFSGRAVH